MRDVINFLRSVCEEYWGQSEIQLLLYIAIIAILLLEKKEWKRITFGWYGILCFIGLLNPVMVDICERVWGDSIAYYCRQFSLIPIFVVISYGVVLMLTKLDEKRKLGVVGLFVILIITSGNQIYNEGWYGRSANYSKIPNEIIQLAQFFETKGEQIKVASSTEISSYMRQYSNIIQPQGRAVWDNTFETELRSSTPNVLELMEYAGKQSCDYIVAQNDENIQEVYEDAGYFPEFQTESYAVYKVENVERWKSVYDEKNFVIEKVYLKQDGSIGKYNDEYSIIRYTYDYEGRIQTERYYDSVGKPIKQREYNCGVKYAYDEAGRCIQRSLLDEDANIMIGKSGYAEVLYEYNSYGKLEYEWFCDTDNHIVTISSGECGWMYTYDEEKRVESLSYLDKDGNIINANEGYAIRKFLYNEDGEVEKEIYYDKDGKQINY